MRKSSGSVDCGPAPPSCADFFLGWKVRTAYQAKLQRYQRSDWYAVRMLCAPSKHGAYQNKKPGSSRASMDDFASSKRRLLSTPGRAGSGSCR